MALYVHQILSVLRDGRQALNFLSFLGCKLAVAGWKVEGASQLLLSVCPEAETACVVRLPLRFEGFCGA